MPRLLANRRCVSSESLLTATTTTSGPEESATRGESLQLGSAAGREVAREEREHDHLAEIVGQPERLLLRADGFPAGPGQREVGRALARLRDPSRCARSAWVAPWFACAQDLVVPPMVSAASSEGRRQAGPGPAEPTCRVTRASAPVMSWSAPVPV